MLSPSIGYCAYLDNQNTLKPSNYPFPFFRLRQVELLEREITEQGHIMMIMLLLT